VDKTLLLRQDIAAGPDVKGRGVEENTFRRHLLHMRAILIFVFAYSIGAAEFKNGIPKDEKFFPLAVWVQSPKNAERFKAAGVNTYVGLWHGPTEEQLAELKKVGMKVVCAQNSVGLTHKNDPMIIGWLQNDEPDNAQSLGQGKGYGPPILPAKVVERHQAVHAADSSRPVLLNLGQGVAWDNYIGRGVRRNHPEDYAEYVKGGDIVSFDIYPATHEHADIKGKLEYVAKGVERLKNWAGPERVVWNCVEAKLGDGEAKVTPNQLRAEVWMSLIHGSKGIIYFVHQFKPMFREASVFEDADLLAEFTRLNKQITELAPVLNGEDVKVETKAEGGPIAAMAKRRGEDIYIFAVGMSGQNATAKFSLPEMGERRVIMFGEGRTVEGNSFSDKFAGYEVRIYRVMKSS
jgi:hypothetical protein